MKTLSFAVYTAAIGLSAFLLFLVQPMIAKLLLPGFGGGASIWITSMVFFQVMLLLGYGLTHWLIKHLGIKRHMLFAVGLLVCSMVAMPLGVASAQSSFESPALHLLFLLLLSVGLPYLMLSTTSPTLQYWMANDVRMTSVNPYVQYGVSNGGSLLGLLIYPFVVEPAFDNPMQTSFWSVLYLLYGAVVLISLMQFVRSNRVAMEVVTFTSDFRPVWLIQAMVPSALLLVVTHYLTLDVVNFPLLWVAPLAIYLTTFIICFLFPAVSKPGQLRTVIAILSLLLLMLTSRPEMGFGLITRIVSALACLFFVCMVFHGDLERNKPDKQGLTGFYLTVAGGGALGSILAGLVSPMVFQTTFEFSIVVLAGLYYVVATGPGFNSKRVLRVFVIAALVLAYVSHETTLDGQTIARERSFYGTYAVRDVDGVRRLVAGTHVHGEQFLDEAKERVPVAYYHKETGAGMLFELMPITRVALIGLGVGSLVEYGDDAMQFDIFELDGAVVRLARTYFSVLSDTPSHKTYVVGDGRLGLQRSSGGYDLIVMDAFTSGSIPTHLVTVEAIDEAFQKLTDNGAIAYHISNHYVDLLPVLAAIADELNVSIRIHESISDDAMHFYPARWVVLSKSASLVSMLDGQSGWKTPETTMILWRDDASDIQSVLKF